jgi:3'-5' exoribonuclease
MSDTLKVGERVERVMVVSKKVRRDFSGGRFLLFQFNDRDGVLKGVWWDPTEDAETSVGVNDVVRVQGEITEYQGALQLKVSWLEKLDSDEYDPSVFLPATPRDPDGLYEEIMRIIESIGSERLQELLRSIFGDESFRETFVRAPAAKAWHHSYIGGLAEHVRDMAVMAETAAGIYPEVDRDLLLAGVLLHDIGKVEELSVSNHISYSDRGRLVGHIVLGVEMLDRRLEAIEGFPEETALRLRHMILSHHGSLEHGSPVLPMTIEGMLLHYLDNLDAQVRGALMALDRGGGEPGWTEYIKLLDRFLYRGGPGSPGGGEIDG